MLDPKTVMMLDDVLLPGSTQERLQTTCPVESEANSNRKEVSNENAQVFAKTDAFP